MISSPSKELDQPRACRSSHDGIERYFALPFGPPDPTFFDPRHSADRHHFTRSLSEQWLALVDTGQMSLPTAYFGGAQTDSHWVQPISRL